MILSRRINKSSIKKSVNSITIPDQVRAIEDSTFSKCLRLSFIYVDSNNSKFTSIDGILFTKDCKTLLCFPAKHPFSNYSIPTTVTAIGNFAFSNCYHLQSITIPASVQSIGDSSFGKCTKLQSIHVDSNNLQFISINGILFTRDYKKLLCFPAKHHFSNYTIPPSVTSIGDFAFGNCTNLEFINVDSKNLHYSSINGILFTKDYQKLLCFPAQHYISNYTIPPSVTSIENSAFSNCKHLQSITIPTSVTSIGDYAFSNCEHLQSITIPTSVRLIGDSAFSNCKYLQSITIPTSVTSIGDSAFFRCFLLQSITIPASVTSIGDYAFSNCKNLQSITIPTSVTSIGDSAFSGCALLQSITIPTSVTSTDHSKFWNLFKFRSSNFNNKNVKYLSKDGILFTRDGKKLLCFPANHELSHYIIPTSVTSIGNYAFSHCSNLQSISIPTSVTSIGDHAFSECSQLMSVTIPASVTSIGDSAFSKCHDLRSIIVNNANPKYISANGILFTKDYKRLLCFPKNSHFSTYTIPPSVESIDDATFYFYSILVSITIPTSVTSIGDDAFSFCWILGSITIPTSVTSIGDFAFTCCWALFNISIPVSVTSIAESAFYSCNNLQSIDVDSKNTQYTSIDGILFTRDYTRLVCFPPNHSISNYVIPPSVISIDKFAFFSCSFLTSITIPTSVTSIGDSVFSLCYDLQSIAVESNNLNYASIDGILFSKNLKIILVFPPQHQFSTYTIPCSVRLIGDFVFSNCHHLQSISIPTSVTSIGDHAFSGCSQLMSVAIPASVTSIGDSAFSHCSNLQSITIPSSVTLIGDFAFSGCFNLQSITIPTSVTSIGESILLSSDNLHSIVIPHSYQTQIIKICPNLTKSIQISFV